MQWKAIDAGALKALEAGLSMGGEASLHCLKAMLSAPTDPAFRAWVCSRPKLFCREASGNAAGKKGQQAKPSVV